MYRFNRKQVEQQITIYKRELLYYDNIIFELKNFCNKIFYKRSKIYGKKQKVIILDLDETLEHGIYQSIYDVGDQMSMVLRPNLDILLKKLYEAKKQDIDIILCTTARNVWVDRFFKLIPEFKNVFDKIYSRDNENEWRFYNKDIYTLENKAQNENINLENMKPITTFGYNSILFVDNNKIEELRLKMLFEMAEGKLQKDVTFFTGFGFYGGVIQLDKMLMYKKI